jgi:multimeric flavodoxin WrbA
MALSALALVCTLKPSPAPSSSDLLAGQLLAELERHGVTTSTVRVIDHDVKHSVEADAGDGDAWPAIREQIHAADILVLATPIWNGQPSSVAAKVYERLNAELSDTDDQGRTPLYGKVAAVVVVGNEDGSYHVAGITHQVLTDMGATVPAQPIVYWHGPTGGSADYLDLDEVPGNVQKDLPTVASNLVHLGALLKGNPYPGV